MVEATRGFEGFRGHGCCLLSGMTNSLGKRVTVGRRSALATLQALVASALGLPILFAVGCDDGGATCDAPNDQGGGVERCANGALIRNATKIASCESILPRADATCSNDPLSDECSTDADCVFYPNGHCDSIAGDFASSCSCVYGCITDADCGADAICVCDGLAGHCEAASCASDADCEAGQLCARYFGDCAPGWACTTSNDNCTGPEDCLPNEDCGLVDGAFTCTGKGICGTGRPFLVDEAPRLAELRFGSAEWAEIGVRPALLADLAPIERERLAARWAEIGLMEHASIAAFARFALELLALGAPPELLVETHAALADETRHARVAFALASAYGDQPVGPGPLSIAGALAPATDPLALLRTLFYEGCVGETVAALEAAEGAARCEDPVIARVLEGIAADESRHAALAWSTVRWLIERTGAAGVAVLEEELRRAEASARLEQDDAGLPLARHGHVSQVQRGALREETLRTLVRPAIEALRAQHLSAKTSSSFVLFS